MTNLELNLMKNQMKNKVSDRDYALEEADDYFQDEYDPTEEAYSNYQYHMDMMESIQLDIG